MGGWAPTSQKRLGMRLGMVGPVHLPSSYNLLGLGDRARAMARR